jgi:site-specific recombinase XerC
MPYIFLDTRKKPHIYRFQYTDHLGRRRSGTGTTSKAETEQMASIVQAKEHAIRRTWAEPPKRSKKEKQRPFSEVAEEYLAWGQAQGGIGGRPWGAKHAEKRAMYLEFWREELGLECLGDVDGCLTRVEKVLRELREKGKSGKTLSNYTDGLRTFCRWCLKREMLESDPLAGISEFDKTPKSIRRALTADEINLLLEASEKTKYGRERRLGYELALASGLRANELKSLRVKHLDVKQCGVRLESAWTKNRKDGFQALPSFLVARLAQVAEGKHEDDPLVFVARESAAALDKDLERAGIKKVTPDGKLDFHALRVAYSTFVVEAGTDIKTAQTLMRHSSPNLTLNTYARARKERLAEVAEKVGTAMMPNQSTLLAHQRFEPCAGGGASTCAVSNLEDLKMVGREGFEPP